MAGLPARERHIVQMYYFGEATMKQIGEAIGVNESRVSQLHARAMQKLRALLAAEAARPVAPVAAASTPARRPRPRLAHPTLEATPSRRPLAAKMYLRPAPTMTESRRVA